MPRIYPYANPPPLPDNLSERLQKTIDQKTGCCIHHPKIRLCELVDNESRWIVRRKTCFQCGCRTSVGGKHHMPGKAIKNPQNSKEREEREDREGSFRRGGSKRRSRSRRDGYEL